MKIIHLIHGLNTGGAETLVKDYALNMDRTTCEVIILCFEHRDSPYETLLQNAGIKVYYADDEKRRVSSIRLLSWLHNQAHLIAFTKRVLAEEKPDILHTHLIVNFIVLMSHPAKTVRLFHTVHSDPYRYWKTKFHSPVLWAERRLDFWSAKRLARRYGMRFITLHQQMCDEVNRLFGVQNTLVLNNAIDFSRFEHLQDKATTRESLDIPLDAFVIGSIGRFAEVKNHSFLVDVFGEVRKKRDDAFLLLVGSGALKEQITTRLKEKKLYAYTRILSNRSDVPDLLNVMDVYAVTSLHEGVPVSLIETQKVGVPCVISSCVPEKAIISNLVQKMDLTEGVEAWADAILHNMKPEQVVYRDLDRWSMSHVVKELEEIYKSNGQ